MIGSENIPDKLFQFIKVDLLSPVHKRILFLTYCMQSDLQKIDEDKCVA